MAETVYNAAKAGWFNGEIDLEADDIRCALLTGSVTISPDHATVAAVIAANTEASDGSYAREAATTESVTQNDTDDRAEFDIDDLDFGALTGETPTAALIYQHNGADSANIPLSIHDSGFGATANGAGYTVTFPNNVIRLA